MNPLEQVYGSRNVADILLKYCDKIQGSRNVLHALGYKLSYKEWILDHENMDNSKYQISMTTTLTTIQGFYKLYNPFFPKLNPEL